MGLDMYLTAELFVGGRFEHRKVVGNIEISVNDKTILSLQDLSVVDTVSLSVAYWRKANQIHKWFVDNCQNGLDECQRVYVDREQLVDLRDLCIRALEDRDAELLPPTPGFFFGGNEIDEWYWKDLEHTRDVINEALKSDLYKSCSFYYQSSW